MDSPRIERWAVARARAPSILIRYGSAFSVVAVAVLLRLWLDPYLERSGFAIFLTGMLLAAWIGGLGPSLICQTLILIAEAFWFSSTHQIHTPTTARGILNLVAFYSVGSIVAILSEAWQAARKRALAQRDDALSQREHLRATISCVGDGVLVTDAEGRVTFMNPIAEAMTGWTLAEAKCKPVRDVFAICDEASQEFVDNPIPRVLCDGQELRESMCLMLTTRNDRRLPIAYSAAPIHDVRGPITGVVLIFRDETERRRTERALREADQRKDEFLATLAHELRNPLAPICMGVELLKISANDRKASEDVRAMMERQAKHMVRLIDDLLDVSRITRGKLELRRSEVRLADVVRNAVDATRPAIDESRHHLVVKLPQRPILLYADPNRITQVLSNLLNNAAKYTPPGGRIELSADQHDGEVVITVSDTGVGISSDMREAIFEMFTQIRGAMESGHKGLGIGLTLVKRLVEMHGGVVEVESEGRNMGSRFRVRLPGIASFAAPQAVADGGTSGSPVRESRRVLVVDDNNDALTTLSKLVSILGNDVAEAHDGLEALELAEQFQPEVVLMDLGMPKLNGYDAARRIRTAPWGLDIVLIATTGWGQEDDRRRTKEAGFDHHLVKPVEADELRQLLDGLVPRRPDDGRTVSRVPIAAQPHGADATCNGHGMHAAPASRSEEARESVLTS